MKKIITDEYKYQCQECGLFYKTKELALECEKWCREHKSCNIEIIKHGKTKEEINERK